ncbi:MAG: metal ABC transporter permease [Spirochaetaceae bacterium]|nr:MAG: metal ABC transporter permease [Spirochaetaceae bacterium]
MNILEIFQYPPLLKGGFALLAAGLCFPLVGVFILRLNLVAFKFTLMHGAFLGSAVALAVGIDPLVAGFLFNIALVLLLAPLSRASRLNAGYIAALFMVVTVAVAFVVIYKFSLPAKDILSLLWGSVFALTNADLAIIAGFAAVTASLVAIFFNRIIAVLYDREIAFSSGINEALVSNLVSIFTGLTVALAMKLIGALLLDSVLVLPAITAFLVAKSARGLFMAASVFGLVFSMGGFVFAITLDIPVSSGVTLVGALVFALCFAWAKLAKKRSLKGIFKKTWTKEY